MNLHTYYAMSASAALGVIWGVIPSTWRHTFWGAMVFNVLVCLLWIVVSCFKRACNE